MRIEIYEDKSDNNVVRMKLEKDANGVCLCAVDGDGSLRAYILSVILDEGIVRFNSIDKDIGLPLDDRGRVRIVGE